MDSPVPVTGAMGGIANLVIGLIFLALLIFIAFWAFNWFRKQLPVTT